MRTYVVDLQHAAQLHGREGQLLLRFLFNLCVSIRVYYGVARVVQRLSQQAPFQQVMRMKALDQQSLTWMQSCSDVKLHASVCEHEMKQRTL